MKIKNRLSRVQPDYLFLLVRRPPGWEPTRLEDVPPEPEVLSVDYVASYEEAREDLLRCNKLALKHKLGKWAVLQSSGGDL